MASGSDKGPRLSTVLEKEPFVSSSAALSDRPVQQGWVVDTDGVDDYIGLPTTSIKSQFEGGAIEMVYKHEGGTQGCLIEYSGQYIGAYQSGSGAATFTSYAGNAIVFKVDGVAMGTRGEFYTAVSDGLYHTIRLEGLDDMGSWDSVNISNLGSWRINGKFCYFKITNSSDVVIGLWYFNQAAGSIVLDASGNSNHGTLYNGALYVVDNTIPIEFDKHNNDGFGLGTIIYQNTGRTRWNIGTLDSFNISRIKLSWYQPVEIVAGSTGTNLLVLKGGSEHSIRLGETTGLAADETICFNGAGSARTWIKDTITVGFHTVEVVSVTASTWEIYLDGVLVTNYRYTSTTNRLCEEVWVGPSSAGNNGTLNAVFYEAKVWDDSDDLRVDIDFKSPQVIEMVSGKLPDVDSYNGLFLIPRDESNQAKDSLGASLLYSDKAFPVHPKRRDSFCSHFDGSNDYVSVGSEAPINEPDFECVFSVDAISGIRSLFGRRSSSTSEIQIQIQSSGKILTNIYGSSSGSVSVEHVLVVGNLYRYKFWRSIADGKIYATLDNLTVGGSYGNEAAYSAGSVLNTPDSTRVGDIDIAGYGVFDGKMCYIRYSGLFEYVFSEGHGSVCYDVSGNANHGLIKNGSTDSYGLGFWAGRQEIAHWNLDNGFNYNPAPFSVYDGFSGFTDGVNITREVFDTELHLTGALSAAYGFESGITQSGKTYRIKFEVYDYLSGGVRFRSGGGSNYSTTVSADGIHEVDLVSDSTTVRVTAVGTTTLKIRNLQVCEIFVPSLRIPALADGSGFDAKGDALSNPSLEFAHNGAETIWDIYNLAEGDNPCPASFGHAAGSTIIFSDTNSQLQLFPPIDSIFRRDKSDNEKDRFLALSQSASGQDLTDLQNYTT